VEALAMERLSLDSGWERGAGASTYRRRLEPKIGWMGMEVSIEIEGLGPDARAFVNGGCLELRAYGPCSYRAELGRRLRFDETNVVVLDLPGIDRAALRGRLWLRVGEPRRRLRYHWASASV
jgi:hypothetical protein